ncbi:RHS repeat domain-containing protein [Paenibacillus motobuensis]|uniref:RHS repeat domain-containing protein n=1 Tax=Paenibacillus motobuensis TaxID=295324 RepID=UPI003624D23F
MAFFCVVSKAFAFFFVRPINNDYSAEKQAKFAYNQRSELVRIEDWNGVTDIQRDVLGQITRVTDPKQRTVNYTWTPVGNKASLITPDGKQTTYDYDALNRLSSVKDHAGTTAYTYNAAGQLIEKIAANGSTTQYSYNSRGLLEKLSEQNQTGNILNKHEYSYDAAGNILKWIETIDGKKRDKSYTYDELNQLIQVIDQGQERTYRYDSFGNRIEKAGTGDSTTYSYNSANQLLEEKSGGVQKKYQYDPRGNLTTVTIGSKTLESYTFDETNRLVQAVKEGKTAEYRYNGQGARIQSKTADNTQDFVTDLTSAYNDLLAVYEGEMQQASYTYGLNRLQAHLPNGQSETYSYDHLGSIVGLQDQQGKMIETHRYDEFGVMQTPTQTDRAVDFAYTGYSYEDNGLYYAQARYYNPEIGRFISEDTYEGNILNPLSQNLYTYAQNNPVGYVDPSGHNPLLFCLIPVVGQATCSAVAASVIEAGVFVIGVFGVLALDDVMESAAPKEVPKVKVPVVPKLEVINGGKGNKKEVPEQKLKPIPVPKGDGNNKKITKIYRMGNDSPWNMTPRPVDVRGGLSFTLKKPASRHVETTIEAINSTGILIAIIDGVDHVSVRPLNGSISYWASQRPNSGDPVRDSSSYNARGQWNIYTTALLKVIGSYSKWVSQKK